MTGGIRSKITTDAYRDGWERTFGKAQDQDHYIVKGFDFGPIVSREFGFFRVSPPPEHLVGRKVRVAESFGSSIIVTVTVKRLSILRGVEPLSSIAFIGQHPSGHSQKFIFNQVTEVLES